MSARFIVSGANGYIGSKVSNRLSENGYDVIGLCRNPSTVQDNIGKVRFLSNEEFLNKSSDFISEGTAFIHIAFARANRGALEIADSVNFTKKVLQAVCRSSGLTRFIYVSTQGVYGKTSQWRSVLLQPEPDTIYSMAKYAAEKLVEQALEEVGSDYCILRLDNVIQSQNLVRTLSKSAIDTGIIKIVGGKQVFSYIDADDASEAIALCAANREKRNQHIYNLGPDRMRISIIELAKILRNTATRYNNSVCIDFEPNDTEMWAGMDSKDFLDDYNWNPQYDIEQMIERVYVNMAGGGIM